MKSRALRKNIITGIVFISLALLHTANAWAVCQDTPDGVELNSQAQVDSFDTDYGPGCQQLNGTLTVRGADITNLDGLAGLTSTEGITLNNLDLLEDISGLSGIEAINSLTITDAPLLSSLSDLKPATTMETISLTNLPALTGISALSPVEMVTGGVQLTNLPLIDSIDGLENLTSVGDFLNLQQCAELVNLNGLAALKSVGDLLFIVENNKLESISGLASLESIGGRLWLVTLPSLPSLDGLQGIQSVTQLSVSNLDLITDIDPLSGLLETTGHLGEPSVIIGDNENLENLDGLANLRAVADSFGIVRNSSLTDCRAIKPLLDDVDDWEPGPGPGSSGIPDVEDGVFILDNPAECDSIESILNSRGGGIFSDSFESLLAKN